MAAELDAASFDRILSTSTYYDGLRDFMMKEYAEESILFWTVCDEFGKIPESDQATLQRDAQKIFSMYLSSASVFEIHIPPSEVKLIFDAIRNSSVDNTLYEKCKQIVAADMLKNVYPRFTTIPTFRHLRTSQNPGLKVDMKDPTEAIKESTTLQRSFNLATIASKTGTTFVHNFYEELFRLSPEARLVFQHKVRAQQGAALQAALKNLLGFLKENDKNFKSHVRVLADSHFRMGITSQMFGHFGIALISTILSHLELEVNSPEYHAVERHWRAVYSLISTEILKAMTTTPSESRFFAKKYEPPQWLTDQLLEYKTYAALTMMLVKSKLGDEKFMVLVYNRFFELSPSSPTRFKNLVAQRVALWGALNSVIKMLGQPAKMRNVMGTLAKTHKARGILKSEYQAFVRAVRQTFRKHLGSDYSESMDAVWKQFLELLTMFMVESADTDAGLPSLTFAALDPDFKEPDNSRLESRPTAQVANAYHAMNDLEDFSSVTHVESSTTRANMTEDEDKSNSVSQTVSDQETSTRLHRNIDVEHMPPPSPLLASSLISSTSSAASSSFVSADSSNHSLIPDMSDSRKSSATASSLLTSSPTSDRGVSPQPRHRRRNHNPHTRRHVASNYTENGVLQPSQSPSPEPSRSISFSSESDEHSVPRPPANAGDDTNWTTPPTRHRAQRKGDDDELSNLMMDLEFFKKRMPGVPEPVLLTQIQKLNDQLLYSTKQLENFSLAEMEAFVAPVTARILAKYMGSR